MNDFNYKLVCLSFLVIIPVVFYFWNEMFLLNDMFDEDIEQVCDLRYLVS